VTLIIQIIVWHKTLHTVVGFGCVFGPVNYVNGIPDIDDFGRCVFVFHLTLLSTLRMIAQFKT